MSETSKEGGFNSNNYGKAKAIADALHQLISELALHEIKLTEIRVSDAHKFSGIIFPLIDIGHYQVDIDFRSAADHKLLGVHICRSVK